MKYLKYSPTILGALGLMILWRWPLAIGFSVYEDAISIPISNGTLLMVVDFQRLLGVLLTPINVDIILRFLVFLVFHLSIPLTAIGVYMLTKRLQLRKALPFFLSFLITLAGTLLVFFNLGKSKEVLLDVFLLL